jgi:hypothetical protein
MKNSFVLGSILAGLLASSQLSAAESFIVESAKADIPELSDKTLYDQSDRLLLQDFIVKNYDRLSPSTVKSLEELVGDRGDSTISGGTMGPL